MVSLNCGILVVCMDSAHGPSPGYSLGRPACLHAEASQSIKCLVTECVLEQSPVEIHMRETHREDLDLLISQNRERKDLLGQLKVTQRRIRQLAEEVGALKRAEVEARDLVVAGLKWALSIMCYQTKDVPAKADRDYRHHDWVKQQVTAGAGAFVHYVTTLLTELQPANTPERQLHVAKAVASALASAFDYGDADFKWSHGSNLMFVLSLLSPKSLASGRD